MKKILRFSAEWCQPCKMLAKNIETANLDMEVQYIDVDVDTDLAAQYKIRGVPTLVMIDTETDTEIKRLVGVKTTAELQAWTM